MASEDCDNIDLTVDAMTIENEEHKNTLLSNMKSLHDSRQLIDVTICIQDNEFPCHRNVLAATSPYFRAMFTTDLNESKQDRITILEVDAKSVQQVIEYAYTGCIEINKGNAQNLLAVASLFQIPPIHSACAKFMESQLDVSNCIGIHYFAQIHGCDELSTKAKEHTEKNFTEVSVCEEFLSLPMEKIGEILSSNELNVEKEEYVFETLLRWIKYDEENHSKFIGDLLPCVRFGLLNSKYVQEHVRTNTTISQCNKCQKLLDNVKEFESNPETYHGEHKFTTVLRSGMIKPEHCLLLIGGVDQSRPSINCYNPLTREAYFMADFQEVGKSGYYDVEDPACVVTDDNQIFVAGGNYIYHESYGESPSDEDSFEKYEEEIVRKDLYCYDNDHNIWLPQAPMLFPKSNFSLACVDGKIYCFGGLTINQHPTEIIEKYDISLNRWSYVGMMPTTLVDLSTVVHNGLIYILGGRTGVGAHNVVMRYDPRKQEWTSLAGMPTPRFNFGACVVNEELYVAGGQIYSHSSHTINREALNSVEIYNIEHNQWRQGPELPEDMYNVGLSQINGRIYACGTTEHHRSAYRIYRYNVVYCYDLNKNEWEQIENDLCDIRDFACLVAKMHTRKLSQVFRPEVDT